MEAGTRVPAFFMALKTATSPGANMGAFAQRRLRSGRTESSFTGHHRCIEHAGRIGPAHCTARHLSRSQRFSNGPDSGVFAHELLDGGPQQRKLAMKEVFRLLKHFKLRTRLEIIDPGNGVLNIHEFVLVTLND